MQTGVDGSVIFPRGVTEVKCGSPPQIYEELLEKEKTKSKSLKRKKKNPILPFLCSQVGAGKHR